jgi:hypothetical protein
MSNRTFDLPYTVGPGRVRICGSFAPIPASAGSVINASLVNGFGFGYAPVKGVMTLQAKAQSGISSTPGIVRTGTGTYTVTLDDSYIACDAQEVQLGIPLSGGTLQATWVPVVANLNAPGLAPTFTIVLRSSGFPTDVGGTGFLISFIYVMRNSTVQYQGAVP